MPLLAYRSETALVNDLNNFILRTRKERFTTLKEFEGGFGRPDLLLYSDPTSHSTKDIESLAALNPRYAPLLSLSAALAVKSLSDLMLVSGGSNETARRIASELARVDRLTKHQTSDQGFSIAPIAQPPFQQVVAIEAKLRDWSRALIQAFRYREFSTQSWVVLDHAHVASAVKQSARFKATGVGLASFSTAGDLHVHVMARPNKWRGSALAWRTQAILAKTAILN